MKFVIIETFSFVGQKKPEKISIAEKNKKSSPSQKKPEKMGGADLDPIKPLCHSMIDPGPNILHYFHPFSPQDPLNRD